MQEDDGDIAQRPGASPTPPPGDPSNWPQVRAWRKAERERLIGARLAIPASLREAMSREIAVRLDTDLGDLVGKTVSIYWPFRGEPDLRPWAAGVIQRGGSIALPVVIEKAHPLQFRRYRPGDRLEKGVWNIPIPADGAVVAPDMVIAPVVGVDQSRYRLGYGGGFFDRTLAAMPNKPLVIGIGYQMQAIATIYPQAHDIPMDRIIAAALTA